MSNPPVFDRDVPPHPATLSVEKLMESCDVKHIRATGPGGQHRNKVSTGVQITHRATGIQGQATERRSQRDNLQMAIRRLRINLAIFVRSELASSQALRELGITYGGTRLRVSETNEDYPSLLTHLLDQIGLSHGGMDEATLLLATSPSQIVRLLREEPRALQQVNMWRSSAGRPPLK